MNPPRCVLFVLVILGVLSFAPTLAAQTPSYETLFVQGATAYGAEDWPRCERVRWDVPPLAVAKSRVEKLNAGTSQPH